MKFIPLALALAALQAVAVIASADTGTGTYLRTISAEQATSELMSKATKYSDFLANNKDAQLTSYPTGNDPRRQLYNQVQGLQGSHAICPTEAIEVRVSPSIDLCDDAEELSMADDDELIPVASYVVFVVANRGCISPTTNVNDFSNMWTSDDCNSSQDTITQQTYTISLSDWIKYGTLGGDNESTELQNVLNNEDLYESLCQACESSNFGASDFVYGASQRRRLSEEEGTVNVKPVDTLMCDIACDSNPNIAKDDDENVVDLVSLASEIAGCKVTSIPWTGGQAEDGTYSDEKYLYMGFLSGYGTPQIAYFTDPYCSLYYTKRDVYSDCFNIPFPSNTTDIDGEAENNVDNNANANQADGDQADDANANEDQSNGNVSIMSQNTFHRLVMMVQAPFLQCISCSKEKLYYVSTDVWSQLDSSAIEQSGSGGANDICQSIMTNSVTLHQGSNYNNNYNGGDAANDENSNVEGQADEAADNDENAQANSNANAEGQDAAVEGIDEVDTNVGVCYNNWGGAVYINYVLGANDGLRTFAEYLNSFGIGKWWYRDANDYIFSTNFLRRCETLYHGCDCMDGVMYFGTDMSNTGAAWASQGKVNGVWASIFSPERDGARVASVFGWLLGASAVAFASVFIFFKKDVASNALKVDPSLAPYVLNSLRTGVIEKFLASKTGDADRGIEVLAEIGVESKAAKKQPLIDDSISEIELIAPPSPITCTLDAPVTPARSTSTVSTDSSGSSFGSPSSDGSGPAEV